MTKSLRARGPSTVTRPCAALHQLVQLQKTMISGVPHLFGFINGGLTPHYIQAAASALSDKTKKLVEALLEDEISCSDASSWEDIDRKVSALSGSVLKAIHKTRMPDTAVPRTNAARAASVLAHVKLQARV